MLKIKGIDISRAQEQFDFTAAASAGVKFVIIRAGIRTDEDTYFRRNIEQCRKLGIDFGCYWYVTATDTAELDRQINACVKAIGDEKPSYPVFCDMEEQRQIDNLTSKERTDMALEFCDRLNKAGLPSGVYANPSWMENYYDKSRLADVDIWLAHWTESPDKPSRYDYGQKMWQWGIDSIAGKDVDGDICFINYPAKTDYWYKTHSGTDTPAKPSDPVKPTTPTAKTYKAGEAVQLSNTALYGSSTTSQPANHLTGTYYIHIADDVLNGRIRITTPKGCSAVTGWVNVSDIGRKTADQPAPSADAAKAVKVGGKVKVNASATFSDGTEPYPFVYTTIFDVITMSKDGKEALIGIGTDVTGWMYVKDLKAE